MFAGIFQGSVQEQVQEQAQQQELSDLLASDERSCQVPASELQKAGLDDLYAATSGALLWRDNKHYEALITALDDMVVDGFDPTLYGVVQLRQWRELPDSDAHLRACRDVLASSAYLTALYHLRYGFLQRSDLEPLWRESAKEEGVEPMAEIMARSGEYAEFLRVAEAGLEDVASAFHWARPQFAHYSRLREAFLDWRDRYRFGDWVQVPPGPVLRPGSEDGRVPLLRQRLELADSDNALVPPPEHRDNVYSGELVAAVEGFQRRHGIKEDGVVGPETIAALNLSRGFRQDQLRANLERLRWLARELRSNQLLVDIAGAEITLFRADKPIWRVRAQVGTAARETPSLSSRITHLTFNPSWTVPPTIYRNDKLPQIRRDPDYLAHNRLRVLDRSGQELDPAGIDWNNPGAIVLRQDPGPANALGQVAIRFPNPFLVYLHDTPNQQLFDRHQRTFSSGCVRVEGAPVLANLLFDGASDDTLTAIARVRKSGETRNIYLPVPLPILMEYWTAAADDAGEAVFRPDIYRRDSALIDALRAQEQDWSQVRQGLAEE